MIPDHEPSSSLRADVEYKPGEGVEDIFQEWIDSNIELADLLDMYVEDLKTEIDSSNLVGTEATTTVTETTTSTTTETTSTENDKMGEGGNPAPETPDGPPDDIRAFYGHPLTAATAGTSHEDTHASAVALLHEYINLPALDKSGMKIGDKINSIYDIMRDDGAASSCKVDAGEEQETPDYMQLLQTTLASDVDKFFSRDGSVDSLSEMSADRCPVGVAEEVIEEICVETDCLDSETDENANLFSTIDTDQSVQGDIQVHMGKPAQSSLDVSVPVLCDINNSSTDSYTATPAFNVPTTSSPTPKVSSVTSTGRKAREMKSHHSEKYQELPKKLVKALTEKILKRRNQQQNPLNDDKSELETAVSNVPVTTSNGHIGNSVNVTDKLSTLTQTHGEPVVEPIVDLTIVEDPTEEKSRLRLPVSTQIPFSQYSPNHINTTPVTSLHDHVLTSESRTSADTTPPPLLTQEKPQCLSSTPRSNCVQSDITKHPQYIRNNSVPCVTNQNSYVSSSSSLAGDPAAAHGVLPYYYPNVAAGYVFPTMHPQRITGNTDRDIMLERYIQQQNQFFSEHPSYQYQGPIKENYSMKSPDSGYSEACVSPKEQNNVQYKKDGDQFATETTEGSAGKVSKRRRSAPAMYVKQYWNPVEKIIKPIVPKLEKDPAGYRYFLETPISTNQRVEEDRMTYVNKGQYYGLTLEHNGERPIKSQMVKSIIMVVFREDKHMEDEKKAWEFWHTRQHSYKQRVIDIDTKNSTGVVPSCIEEIAFNGVAVRWNPRDSPVKVNVAVHCLSTDFSNQKGVKGLPMHLQIDTYENTRDSCPASRSYCQIKIFCDKGAERKTRDEERRKQCRGKSEAPSSGKVSRKRHEEVFHEPMERSEFYIMSDLTTQPVLFSPTFEGDESTRTSPLNVTSHDEDGSSSITSSGDHYDSTEDGMGPIKRARTDSYSSCMPFQNILLYVREQHEVVFTAVMLRSPTLYGLLQAIEEKYHVPASTIKNAYKRSRKGILVRMDDNIVRHYSHESTFMIELKRIPEEKDFELILTEIDPS